MRRRTFLSALLALSTLTQLTPRAALADQDLDAERRALLDGLQQALLSFDVRQVVADLAEALGVPARIRRGLDEALQGRDTARGFASVQALFDDRELVGLLEAEARWFTETLGGKLWLLRRTRAAPQTPEARAALREQIYTLLGLDLEPIRAHLAAYDTPELAIVYGPVTSRLELAGLLLREPYALLVQLATGRRAVELHPRKADPIADMLEVLLDPTIREVVFTGHGTWTSLTLYGYLFDPEAIEAKLLARARDTPRDFLQRAAKGLRHLAPEARYWRDESLEEERLAALLDQAFPTPEQRAAIRKERIVRHTCGHGRYGSDADLLWRMLPEELSSKLVTTHGGLSAIDPASQGTWEAQLEAWLSDKSLEITERASFGECLVASPGDVRGYEGSSWLPDFVQDPIPAYRPPHPPWARPSGATEATPGGATEPPAATSDAAPLGDEG